MRGLRVKDNSLDLAVSTVSFKRPPQSLQEHQSFNPKQNSFCSLDNGTLGFLYFHGDDVA